MIEPLPLYDEQMTAAHREQRPDRNKVRTLIVDDSAFVRGSIIDFLAAVPRIEVIGTAADGKEALALIVERQPDLVIMDLNMPVMDGLKTMRRIRNGHPSTRVIMMTLSAEPAVEARCREAGAHAFLSKEDMQRNLRAAITNLFPELTSGLP